MNIIELSLKNYYKPYGHLFVQVGANKMEGGGVIGGTIRYYFYQATRQF